MDFLLQLGQFASLAIIPAFSTYLVYAGMRKKGVSEESVKRAKEQAEAKLRLTEQQNQTLKREQEFREAVQAEMQLLRDKNDIILARNEELVREIADMKSRVRELELLLHLAGKGIEVADLGLKTRVVAK